MISISEDVDLRTKPATDGGREETVEAGALKPDVYRYLMYLSVIDRPVLQKEAADLDISMNRVIRRALHLYFKIPPATRHSLEYPHDL